MDKLVTAAQNGDKESFILLIESNKVSLTRAAMAILKNDEDVADAVAETVLCAYKKLPTLKKACYFKTWITRILLNNCYMLLKSRKNIISIESVSEQTGYYSENDQSIDVNAALNRLSENDRLLLTLYHLDGFSIGEIAEMTGENINTIKSRLSRGRAKFKRIYVEMEVGANG